MFSTVDSPAARFLRVYLVGRDSEIPVLVPGPLREAAYEIRTVPSRARALELAESVHEGIWVRLRMTSAVEYYRQLFGSRLQDKNVTDSDVPDGTGGVVTFEDLDFVRMLEDGEMPSESDVEIEFEHVRIEFWQYVFQKDTTMLRAEKVWQVRFPAGDASDA